MRNAFSLTLSQFGGHVFCFVARAGILFEKIWEEEHLQYSEHDKELDAYHEPQRPPKCHRAEALVVEVEGASKEAFRVHNRHKDRYFVARAKFFRYFINEKERKQNIKIIKDLKCKKEFLKKMLIIDNYSKNNFQTIE